MVCTVLPGLQPGRKGKTTQDAATQKREDRSSASVSIERVGERGLSSVEDFVAVEEPLEIRLGFGPRHDRSVRSITVTMRTPGADAELAAGFLVTEGVVRDADDIVDIAAGTSISAKAATGVPAAVQPSEPDTPASAHLNTISVELAEGVAVNMATLERNFYTTSSCGICGKASLLALRSVCPPRLENHFMVSAAVLHRLPAALRDAQQVFDRTGGLHGAGLFTESGELLMLREDVGRHNAVDKLLGAQFLAGNSPLRDRLLLLSGRASFELLQKAVMAGIPLVAAVGAPSSLAVEVARAFDVTLVGFLRENRFNIYHGAERIRSD